MAEVTITVFGLQATLLILILTGAVGKKIGVITEGFGSGLSKFLLNTVLPCGILNAFSRGISSEGLSQSVQVLIMMTAIHLVYMLLGLLYRSQPPDRRPVYQFAVLCPNTNFMGLPVVGGIYGDIGTVLVSIALFPVRVFVMSVGTSYFVIGQSGKWILKLFKNPNVWAVLLGVVMMVLNIHFPTPLSEAISGLGACTTPLSMILIGGVICDLKREMFKNSDVWKFCILRLLLIPLGVLAIVSRLPVEATAAGVVVMLTALPAGAMTVIYTKEYQKDEKLAAACVIFSTLLSIVTIPLVNLACMFVL